MLAFPHYEDLGGAAVLTPPYYCIWREFSMLVAIRKNGDKPRHAIYAG
jgi:hypothetical protein